MCSNILFWAEKKKDKLIILLYTQIIIVDFFFFFLFNKAIRISEMVAQRPANYIMLALTLLFFQNFSFTVCKWAVWCYLLQERLDLWTVRDQWRRRRSPPTNLNWISGRTWMRSYFCILDIWNMHSMITFLPTWNIFTMLRVVIQI